MAITMNYFPNPGTIPGGTIAPFDVWAGSPGNAAALQFVAANWATRGYVLMARWSSVQGSAGSVSIELAHPGMVPGKTYTISYIVLRSETEVVGAPAVWSDASGSDVSVRGTSGAIGSVPAWSGQRRWVTFTLAPGAFSTHARVVEDFPSKKAGAEVTISAPVIYEGSYQWDFGYLDGDVSPGPGEAVGWVGAPGRSASFRVTPEIDLKPVPDGTPCPYVEIVARDLPPSTSKVTIWRTAAGRTTEVRGAVRASASDALARVDYEAPFGVPITYRVEPFTASGESLGLVGLSETQLDVEETWVHNPLNPAGAVAVSFRGSAVSGVSRPMDAEVHHPIGRRVGVVVSSGRRGVTDVSLDVMTETLEAADRVAALLGDEGAETTPVLCFRVGANDRVRLPRPFFAVVPDIVESSFDYTKGTGTKIAHSMKGTEAAPPAPGLFIPLLTYAHLNAYYATYAALNADNATYLAVNTRYDLVR